MQDQDLSKKIAECTSEIAECTSEIARLESSRERCDSAVESANQRVAAIADLTERRAREVAAAFIENRSAVVATIDKELSTAEKLGTAAREHGAAARDGLALIEQRLVELRAELASERAALKILLIEELTLGAVQAREEFNAAVNSLRAKLEDVSAADSMIATLRGVVSQSSASSLMIDALRDEGLKIFTHKGPWGPGWLHNFTAAEGYKRLVTQYKELGLDI